MYLFVDVYYMLTYLYVGWSLVDGPPLPSFFILRSSSFIIFLRASNSGLRKWLSITYNSNCNQFCFEKFGFFKATTVFPRFRFRNRFRFRSGIGIEEFFKWNRNRIIGIFIELSQSEFSFVQSIPQSIPIFLKFAKI
jgi:hypothetical protein